MALLTVVAGRYSGTYSGNSVGITENGYDLEQTSSADMVGNTDAYGDTVVDWVYRGGNVFLSFESKEYLAGAMAAFWPWGAKGQLTDTATPVGRMAWDTAAAMVLTAVANTPAAANGEATLTGSKAILAPNYPARLLFNTKVRNVPVRLQLLPYVVSGSNIRWFTFT